MNNDLIGRSELLKSLHIEDGGTPLIAIQSNAIYKTIKDAPTAFDKDEYIDKVVQELDEYLTQLVGRNAKLYTTVMDIVKRGNLDD